MAVPQSKDPDDDPGAALGETLKDLRLAAGLATREAAGCRIGYSKDSIGKAETGGHVPTLEMLLLMLDLYQVSGLMRKTVLRPSDPTWSSRWSGAQATSSAWKGHSRSRAARRFQIRC